MSTENEGSFAEPSDHEEPRRRGTAGAAGAGDSGAAADFRTRAVPACTSTDQQIESPASSPRTVATACGTVVFRDSEEDCDRNAFDSNSFGMSLFPEWRGARGHKTNLSRGRRLDLILKYRTQVRSNDSPMPGTKGAWDAARELRAIRMKSTHRNAVRPTGMVVFQVRSASDTRDYRVTVDELGWKCDCADWMERETPCKHILGAVVWLNPNPPALAEETSPRRPTHKQSDWGAYDLGQQREHELFDAYLWDLLGDVPQRLWTGGKTGRPAIPLRTQLMMSVRKVHLNQSTRRARGLLVALNADGKGLLSRIPNYSVPSRFFNRPQATGILLGLIERSGLALAEIEDGGTVAIDSSGFSTSTMGAYYTELYEPLRRHRFVKVHMVVGTKTHIVLAAKITDEHGADCPEFIPLLNRVAELGHTPARVAADKAYLSRDNLAKAGELGIDPFIPFKLNSRGLAKGSPMWSRKYHEFQLRRDAFDAAYHQRSNVEATFSAMKRKLGENLLSKTAFARLNEMLAKVLAYNVGVVIAQVTRLGLDEGPSRYIPRPPATPSTTAEATA